MPFANFRLDELLPGRLGAAFQAGAVAAIIECSEITARLWSLLLLNPGEMLPWDLPLLDIARNHWSGRDLTSTVGDVFYFQPGQHSYIGRKLEITRANGAGPEVRPDRFHQPGGPISPPEEMVELSCSVVDRIMRSLVPADDHGREYCVAVQRLKYQGDWADFERLSGLVSDSLGRWGRSGYSLDVSRQQPAGKLSGKGISDMLGLMMMAPFIGKLVRRWNDRLAKRDPSGALAPGEQVYERAHEDYRFFSALFGVRENVRTEVLDRGSWVELPVNLDSLVVFPGTLLAGAGQKPTRHRVIYQPKEQQKPDMVENVTVLLGAA